MMTSNFALPIMLTTKCSAKCTHCPFSNPNLKELHLPTEMALKAIDNSNHELFVLSGGEPFEYPDLTKLLLCLRGRKKLFRIATGGFIDLTPWIKTIKETLECTGISIGTDVFFERSLFFSRDSWQKNVDLLNEHCIPYSITLTILNGQNLSSFQEIKAMKNLNPEFYYIRLPNENAKKYKTQISESLGLRSDCYFEEIHCLPVKITPRIASSF